MQEADFIRCSGRGSTKRSVRVPQRFRIRGVENAAMGRQHDRRIHRDTVPRQFQRIGGRTGETDQFPAAGIDKSVFDIFPAAQQKFRKKLKVLHFLIHVVLLWKRGNVCCRRGEVRHRFLRPRGESAFPGKADFRLPKEEESSAILPKEQRTDRTGFHSGGRADLVELVLVKRFRFRFQRLELLHGEGIAFPGGKFHHELCGAFRSFGFRGFERRGQLVGHGLVVLQHFVEFSGIFLAHKGPPVHLTCFFSKSE